MPGRNNCWTSTPRGVEVPGVILQAQTTVYRSAFGVERSRKHEIVYAYRMLGVDDLCVKAKAEVSAAPTSCRVAVLVLPDYPESGCLKELVAWRGASNALEECNFFVSFLFLVPLLVFVFFIVLVMACPGDLGTDLGTCALDTPFLPVLALVLLGLMGTGYYVAGASYTGWEKRMLQGCQTLSPRRQGGYSQIELQDTPNAEVLAVMDGEGNGDGLLDAEASGMEEGRASAAVTATATAVPTATVAAPNAAPVAVVAEASIEVDSLSFYNPQKTDEKAMRVRLAVHRNNWAILRDIFAELHGNHIERRFYISVIESALEETWKANKEASKEEEFSPVLDAWVRSEPNNPDCCLIRGTCYILWAWDARGSGLANTVGRDAWPKFLARIDQAKAELEHASEVDSSDALACAYYGTVFRAQKGRDEAGARALMARLSESDDPHNLLAHSTLLQFYCEKWGGSNQAMFAFARHATKNLPEGHPLWLLIVQAHYEGEMILTIRARQTRNPQAIYAALVYWKQRSVIQEILHSYQQYIGSSRHKPPTTVAEESVLMNARNWYAFALAAIGRMDMARRELLLIGKHPTERPWHSLERYQRACNEAGVSL